VQATGATTAFGLTVVIFAGGCFSLFSPAFNLATNDQWHTLKSGVPHLVVYTAFFYFSTSAFAFGIITNMIFLYRPILGLPPSNFKAYLQDWHGRPWALLAGLLCGFGNGFQFMGGQAAGYAAADAVQVCAVLNNGMLHKLEALCKCLYELGNRCMEIIGVGHSISLVLDPCYFHPD
jgi:hypothetical protein